MSTNATDQGPSTATTGGKIKQLFRKYGKVALGVHLAVYATCFAGKTIDVIAPPSLSNFLYKLFDESLYNNINMFFFTLQMVPGCYVAIDQKVDVRSTLEKYGLLSAKRYDEAAADNDPDKQGWLEKILTGGTSSVALAFLCNKALFPVRAPITLALTPAVARWEKL